MLETEVILTKIKSYFEKLISGLIIVEERIWKFEDLSLEIIHTKLHREGL